MYRDIVKRGLANKKCDEQLSACWKGEADPAKFAQSLEAFSSQCMQLTELTPDKWQVGELVRRGALFVDGQAFLAGNDHLKCSLCLVVVAVMPSAEIAQSLLIFHLSGVSFPGLV